MLLLSLPSGCVISRVCMWAFSFLRVIYTVSLSSQLPSECCVCLCCRVWLNFFAFLLPTVFIRVAPYPTGLHLGKQTHRNCNLERFHLEKHIFLQYNEHIYMYTDSCTDQSFQALNKTYSRHIPRCASLHVHEL